MDGFSLYYKIFPNKYLADKLSLMDFSEVDNLTNESFFWEEELIFRIGKSINRDIKMLYFNGINGTLIKALEDIFITENKNETINFSIKQLNGITCSKSSGYNNFHQFAFSLKPKDCQYLGSNLIKFESEEDFYENIGSVKRSFGTDYVFTLYYQEWNNKYYLANDDQSHHLAAIYRQCYEQNRDYFLKCRVSTYKINTSLVNFITNNYFSYLYRSKMRNDVLWGALYDMKIPAAHFKDRYSFQDDNYYYVFLPQNHKYSREVNKFLQNNSNLFYDLNNYFISLKTQSDYRNT